MFIRNRNEPYLPLPSQPQLVLIYWAWRDGRLSRPWCEVAQAEIRTRNLPIANPALYHTARRVILRLTVYSCPPGREAWITAYITARTTLPQHNKNNFTKDDISAAIEQLHVLCDAQTTIVFVIVCVDV